MQNNNQWTYAITVFGLQRKAIILGNQILDVSLKFSFDVE